MAVIGAVIGIGAIGAVVYENHSDYSNYSNYSYSDYSDASERRRRRMAEKESQIAQTKYEINAYKSESVNPYLMTQTLIRKSGVEAGVNEVNDDGNRKINQELQEKEVHETADIQTEINLIEDVLLKINQILKENEEQ